jgi:hypothetical protein
MEDTKVQADIWGWTALVGFFESIVVWGLLYFWVFANSWSEEYFLPALPYFIGLFLLLQILFGVMFGLGKIVHRPPTSTGKLVLYSALVTLTIPPLLIVTFFIINVKG